MITSVLLFVSNPLACGACTSTGTATAGFSDFGWIHLACCGTLLLLAAGLLFLQKFSGKSKE